MDGARITSGAMQRRKAITGIRITAHLIIARWIKLSEGNSVKRRSTGVPIPRGSAGLRFSDLMLVQADTVDETVQFIRRHLESIAEPAIAAEITAVEQEAAKKTAEEAKRKPAAAETVTANVIPTPSTVAKM